MKKLKNNGLYDFLKEVDPDFKKFLEEKITINREGFQKAIASVYDLGPDSTASDIIKLTEISKNLWNLLRKYHV